MGLDFGKPPTTNLKALACVFCPVLSWMITFANAHPVAETGLTIVLLMCLLSILLAVLSIKDIVRKRLWAGNFLPIVIAVILAVTSTYYEMAVVASHRAAERWMATANRVKQLTVALLDYEKANGCLPPATIRDRHGEALLSWRVRVLPYLDEEVLFKRFKLDEAWDSPHNLPLLRQMPEVFTAPAGVKFRPGHSETLYQVFVGKDAAFEGEQGIRLADFSDGVAQTILVVEAGKGVPWTKPGDLSFSRDRPLPPLGARPGQRFCAGMADGSVRSLRKDLDPQVLQALVARNGGKELGTDWDR